MSIVPDKQNTFYIFTMVFRYDLPCRASFRIQHFPQYLARNVLCNASLHTDTSSLPTAIVAFPLSCAECVTACHDSSAVTNSAVTNSTVAGSAVTRSAVTNIAVTNRAVTSSAVLRRRRPRDHDVTTAP
jgi:hypothetical protein